MARIVFARLPPTSTWYFLSAWNAFRLRAAATRGKTSTSPDSSAATCAAGSLMKRIVTRLSFTSFALRQPSQRSSVTAEPLAQLSSRYGPVPTGWVWLLATLFGSTITAVAWPSLNSRSGSPFFRFSTTLVAPGVSMRSMLAKLALSLLVLALSAARSKLNLTAALLNGSPL